MTVQEVGASGRAYRAKKLDVWLAGLLPDHAWETMALMAVGGLGRGECAPHSDIDLVLLHDGQSTSQAEETGAAMWYTIWDTKYSLDHSIRSVDETMDVINEDLKAALGILDARLIAGNEKLFTRLREESLTRWRMDAKRRLCELRQLTHHRWNTHGELAFLLEGDVKESRGGLRDFNVLRSIGYAGIADVTRPAVRAAHRFLLDIRDAMHIARGRRIDRLLAQDRIEVARLLDLADGDEVLRRIAEAARTTAHTVDDGLRAVDRWISGRNTRRQPIGRDVVQQDGEAVLARKAITPLPDPCLALRVAASAARATLPIARATLEWLAAFGTPLPEPWPGEARDALLTLLGSGPSLIPTWETCDRYGLVTTWIPELARVRSLPQHNPVHLYTVDRHLVEVTLKASELAREVDRPDLLLISALLHDIGKGLPGDHSAVGTPIATRIARRMGLPPDDVSVVERLVRHHLLLPDTATRRDLSDPAVITKVADAVGDRSTLALLHALARADAAGTGPAAWSTWKGKLVAELVVRVDRVLGTGVVPEPAPRHVPAVTPDRLPFIQVGLDRVDVIAAKRWGLLASVAGCLALHRLEVVTADTWVNGGVVQLSCGVQPRFGPTVDLRALAADLHRAIQGELDVATRIAARERSTRTVSHSGTPSAASKIVWYPATNATILELRAADSAGLLYRVARTFDDQRVEIRAARISTLGADVVDAFYLTGDWDDPLKRQQLENVVISSVGH